jgi:hypothetical protein
MRLLELELGCFLLKFVCVEEEGTRESWETDLLIVGGMT